MPIPFVCNFFFLTMEFIPILILIMVAYLPKWSVNYYNKPSSAKTQFSIVMPITLVRLPCSTIHKSCVIFSSKIIQLIKSMIAI